MHNVHVHHPRADAAVVELQGEHDLDTRDELHELLARLVEQHDLVVVDVSQALFIDSSVLGNLARAHRQAGERGSCFRIQLGTAPIVRKALEISGLLGHLECVGDRTEALSPRARDASLS